MTTFVNGSSSREDGGHIYMTVCVRIRACAHVCMRVLVHTCACVVCVLGLSASFADGCDAPDQHIHDHRLQCWPVIHPSTAVCMLAATHACTCGWVWRRHLCRVTTGLAAASLLFVHMPGGGIFVSPQVWRRHLRYVSKAISSGWDRPRSVLCRGKRSASCFCTCVNQCARLGLNA